MLLLEFGWEAMRRPEKREELKLIQSFHNTNPATRSVNKYQGVFELHGFYITRRFYNTRRFDGINRISNGIHRLINGITRLING